MIITGPTPSTPASPAPAAVTEAVSATLTVGLSVSEKAEVAAEAKRTGQSMSAVARRRITMGAA